jgi:MoxR-like ATPase
MQKDRLGQDVFLIGPPGSFKRNLALEYANLAGREVEYVPLSKDVTDGDLKMRREISSGSAFYTEQACVRAAIQGRILILDGIEKAERNVLPIINNLLENREMQLDDGRFLVHPQRFENLAKEHKTTEFEKWKLVKVSERFFVIALGVPVPRYEGYPLDPPLRSRFQARNIAFPGFDAHLQHLQSIAPNAKIQLTKLISLASTIRTLPREAAINIPEFPGTLDGVARTLQALPRVEARFLLDVCYPWALLPGFEAEKRNIVEAGFKRFGMLGSSDGSLEPGYRIASLEKTVVERTVDGRSGIAKGRVTMTCISEKPDVVGYVRIEKRPLSNLPTTVLQVYMGSHVSNMPKDFVETDYHSSILASMMIAHTTLGDFCVVGEKGAGKSAVTRAFARILGYRVEFIPLYRDMSSRDLLQRRSTTLAGDTVWENSPLVKAALEGSLAVLDCADSILPATLCTLARLISEREIPLPDGSILIHPARYAKLMKEQGWHKDDLDSRRIYPVHPSFRLVALARPNVKWLTEEAGSLMHWIVMRGLKFEEEMHLIHTLCPGANQESLGALVKFAEKLRNDPDEMVMLISGSLSTRQLLRIARRISAFPDESLWNAVHKVSLSRFLPNLARAALDNLLMQNGITVDEGQEEVLKVELIPSHDPKTLKIGNVSAPIQHDSNPLLVPDIVFHDNQRQSVILREMLKDWTLGEDICLIGNQGVGKNKLTDRFLQLMRLPRAYQQLHRDSTIQSLTATPSIVDGVLQYEDSPLLDAVKNGYVLVIDEADKAPTHVTQILKSLVEDGEMVLSDGRRIVREIPPDVLNVSETETDSEFYAPTEYIQLHPSFRMMVLANRPGFPFLGNDFFREIGDVFSSHSIDNPDQESELAMLRKYAPHVPEDVLVKLTQAFNDLRRLVDEGLISYPYSTRELVNIVRHLEQFPDEGLSKAVRNVFDFDQYEKETKDLLIEMLQKNGIPAGLESDFRFDLGKEVLLEAPSLIDTWTQLAKEDICQVSERPINSRGGWKVALAKEVEDINRFESRSITFSEQMYSFKVPVKTGEAMDVICAQDGRIFVLTSNPVAVHVVHADHKRLIATMDLYEYFPMPRSTMQLRMTMLGAQNLCIHNPVEHSLLVIDLKTEKIISVLMPGLEPHPHSVMVSDLANQGIIIVYQPSKSAIVVFDFNTNIQHTVRCPLRVARIYCLEQSLWLCQSYDFMFDRRQSFMLSSRGESWVPSVLNVIASTREKVPELLHVGRGDKMPIMLDDPAGVATFIDGANWNNAHIYAMPALDPTQRLTKPIATLATEHLSLKQTQQVANVFAMDSGKSEGWLDIVNLQQAKTRRIRIPLAMPPYINQTSNIMYGSSVHDPLRHIVHLAELPDGNLITLDMNGTARVWQVRHEDLVKDANAWRRLVGSLDEKKLRIIYGDEEETSGKGEGKGEGQGEGKGNGEGEGDGEGKGEGSMRGSGGSGSSDDTDLKGRESGTIEEGFVLVC